MTKREHSTELKSFKGLDGRIGILGGTFDPVHLAHIKNGLDAKESKDLNTVVYIPAEQNPLKSRTPSPQQDRLNMLQLGLEDHPGLFYSKLELDRKGTSFTVDTLREIRAEVAPSAKLFLIIGSDCLPDLHRWKDIDEIFKLAEPIVLQRHNFDQSHTLGSLIDSVQLSQTQKEILRANFIQRTPLDIASSDIRASGNDAEMLAMMPKKVAEYFSRMKK